MTEAQAVSSTVVRLERAADEVDELRVQLDVALSRRDELIVLARSEGMSQKAISRAARISAPHVLRVLAAAEPSMVLPT